MGRQPRYPVDAYRKELGERLTSAIARVKNKADVAHSIGISVEQMNKWLRGDVKVPAEGIRGIARHTRVDFSWLVTGEGQMLKSDGQPDPAMVEGTLSTFTYLPFYEDVHAAAGAGAAVVSDAAHSIIGLDRQVLYEVGASPQNCTIIRARGDSMQPTIPDGSLLIVDHSQRAIANGCIMVIGVGEDLLVKRVRRRLDGAIELVSDNNAYPPESVGPTALEQLRIVGRVVYFCRTP